MKTNILNLIMAVGVLFLSSCEGFLSVTPHDSLNNENAMETVDDYNNVMLSCYQLIRIEGYSNFIAIIPDVMSDNLLLCSDGRLTWNEYFDFKESSTTFGTANLWYYGYKSILSANEIITRMEQGSPLSNDNKAKNILAEALVFRAYIHFTLVRYYGKAYTSASDTDLGVPYKKSTNASERPARETVKKVYENIIADLIKAKEIMADDYNATVNNRINRLSLHAILAKVYFNMADYSNAATTAAAAVKGDGSDIVAITDYTKMWTTSMKIPEVLFRIAVLQTDDEIPGNIYGQGAVSNHRPEYVASQSFFQLFDVNTDIRASNIQEVTFNGKQYNAIWKYRGRTGESTGKTDIPLLRTSEIYLTLAEALARKIPTDLAGARANLDYVRSKRYSAGNIPTITDAQLLETIALERRLELAFEGDRFFEFKRLNMDITRDGDGDLADGTGVKATVTNIAKTSPYFMLPIPQDEMNANSNMIQNQY